jgi:hypothetical protein
MSTRLVNLPIMAAGAAKLCLFLTSAWVSISLDLRRDLIYFSRSMLEVLLRFDPLELGEDDEDGDLVLGGLT